MICTSLRRPRPRRAARRARRGAPRTRRGPAIAPASSAASRRVEVDLGVLEVGLASATQAGPPSASQAPSTAVAQAAAQTVRQRARRAPRARARAAQRPSSVSAAMRASSCISSAHGARVVARSASAARSASVRPHQGARSTASQARRSAGCASARVSASRSCTTGRVAERLDLDRAERAGPPACSCGTISRRWPRLRTRIATLASGSASRARADDVDDARRFASRRRRRRTDAPTTASPGSRRVHRGRRGVGAPRPRRRPRARASPAGTSSFTHSTMPACERKLADELERLERDAADALVRAALQEQRRPRPRGSGRSTASDRRPRTACARRRAPSRR